MPDKPAIPDFESHQEMAEWFETHEPLDYDVSLIDPDKVKVSLKQTEKRPEEQTPQPKAESETAATTGVILRRKVTTQPLPNVRLSIGN